MSSFDQAFDIVVDAEGAYTSDPADPGNWTSGVCGRGKCLGTKYGISAAAYPNLNIVGLTLDQAREIYRTDFWLPLHGNDLPPRLALLVFDAAVNCGMSKSIRWLQTSIGCSPDGVAGPATMAAAAAVPPGELATRCAHMLALRLTWLATLPTWRHFGMGWSRRICALPYRTIT